MKIMKQSLFFLLFLILGVQAQSQNAPVNVTLMGHLPGLGQLNDCWGWWDAAGNEYAIVGKRDSGTVIVDITDAQNPSVVAEVPGVPSVWRDIKSFGDYVYVVNDNSGAQGRGLLIIDMSNLPNVTYKDTVIGDLRWAHNIYIDDGYAYIAGGNDNNGINILNLNNDPWNPEEVGRYTRTYCHDVYVRDDIMYTSELSQGLTMVDVSDKGNPQVIGRRPYPGNFTHNAWLSDDGDICYTTDEVAGGFVRAFDVSDPGNIRELDTYQSSQPGAATIPHNVHVLNDYLVTSYYRDGMTIVDATRPGNMVEVGHYDTSPLSGYGFDGDWGAYPYFPSGAVVTSDLDQGLFVFDVDYQRGCYLEGEVTDATNGNTIPDVRVEVINQDWSTEGNTQGFYATGTKDPGSYDVIYAAYGYYDKIVTVSMTQGQLTIQDVQLDPLPVFPVVIGVLDQDNNPIPNASVVLHSLTGLASFEYTADDNGEVILDELFEGEYEVIGGYWGWVPEKTTLSVASGNNHVAVLSLDPGYEDDFSVDQGWTLETTAATGAWERGTPIQTFRRGNIANPGEDLEDDLSSDCYMTGNGGVGPDFDDVDDGYTEIISPPMDLTVYEGRPMLELHRWFFAQGRRDDYDTLWIEIDNGARSVELLRIDSTEPGWIKESFDLRQVITLTNNMRLKVRVQDSNPGQTVEAAIDGFKIVGDRVTIPVEPVYIDFVAFPNPLTSSSVLYYSLGADPLPNPVVEIFDSRGRIIFQKVLTDKVGEIKLEYDIPQGVYLARIRTDEGTFRTFSIVR